MYTGFDVFYICISSYMPYYTLVVPIVLKRTQMMKVACSYHPTYSLKAILFANSEKNLYQIFSDR